MKDKIHLKAPFAGIVLTQVICSNLDLRTISFHTKQKALRMSLMWQVNMIKSRKTEVSPKFGKKKALINPFNQLSSQNWRPVRKTAFQREAFNFQFRCRDHLEKSRHPIDHLSICSDCCPLMTSLSVFEISGYIRQIYHSIFSLS